MKRPFEFDRRTKDQAFFRQYNLCAVCGGSLVHEYDHAHHVIPNQTGNVSNPADAFLRSVENCVMLCEQCHERVHQDGRFQAGAIPPPDYYRHSHGKNMAEHNLWVARVTAEWDRKFPIGHGKAK